MTGSFTLRRVQESDAAAIHALRSLPETRRYQPLVPGSVAELERMLAERGAAPLNPHQAGKVQWAIEVDGETAGWVSIDVTSRSHHIANLGYSLDPRYQGRGIMTRAVLEVMPIAFDPNGLAIERLEAEAAVENTASRRVLEKCGFQFEGIARGYLIVSGQRLDHARYACLHTDPLPTD